ncbi:putative MFS family arabinose efflux permease [Stella humosa]|uniref:Putative MFS family arabinose efflux permease n=1 Tax=Stella humosa TaxID=94 RepID=A0A3N1KY94_9PROT|nr:MFS transporter [Stella humosa]ROP84412.1 putative MFS family arabinose efflux permease [Stella humosa]BBK33929.1 MFS transporter [Stella humosa]
MQNQPLPGRVRPAAARRATAVVFFANGAGFGLWAAHIPAIKDGLGLSEGELGLALLMLAAGAVATMPLAGRCAVAIGSRPTVLAVGLAFAAFLALPPLAPSLAVLMATCLLLGAANGAIDVAMNTHATAVERAWDGPIMSSFHAFYSLGGLAGATAAGLAIWAGAAAAPTMAAGSAVLLLAVAATAPFLAVPPLPAVPRAGTVRPHGPVVRLGILALLGFLAEGSLIDWCAVYMVETVGTSQATGAAGYAAFSLAMTTARLTGDRVAARLGPERTLTLSGLVAAAGLGLAVALPHPLLAPAGFALAGLGLANIVPLLFGAAARVPGVAAGDGVAMVAVFGYTGALAGPPLIGFAAEWTSLRTALCGLAVAAAVIVPLVPWALGRRVER